MTLAAQDRPIPYECGNDAQSGKMKMAEGRQAEQREPDNSRTAGIALRRGNLHS